MSFLSPKKILIAITGLLWVAVIAAAFALYDRIAHPPLTLAAFNDPHFNPEGVTFYMRQPGHSTYGLRPGAMHHHAGHEYQVNSGGFRDREFPVTKPEGRKRIIFIGDSFTFGDKLPLDDTSPKLLEQLIWRSGYKNWETLNFGVGGYQAVDEVLHFEEDALQYAPDVLIVMHWLNDALSLINEPPFNAQDADEVLSELADYAEDKLPAERDRVIDSYLWSYGISRTFLKFLMRLDNGREDHLNQSYRLPFFWRNITQSFKRFRELAVQYRFPVVLVAIPHTDYEWETYPFHAIRESVMQEALRNGFFALDIYPIFSAFPDRNALRVERNDGHTSARANALIAEAIFKRLKQVGILPPPVSEQ